MPNVMQVLRSEITRLARKEVKASVSKVHKPTVQLKRNVAALKRIVASLAKENKRLSGVLGKIVVAQPTQPSELTTKARLTGKGIRSLRRKLRLSQADFGRLIGVSSQSVVNMEKKNGPLAVRKFTKAAIVAVREMGAREARAKLGGEGAVKKASEQRKTKK